MDISLYKAYGNEKTKQTRLEKYYRKPANASRINLGCIIVIVASFMYFIFR
jgi:hypothetical protein